MWGSAIFPWLLFVSALGASDSAWPQAALSPFAAGNAYYERGEYEAAWQQYLLAMQQGPLTPSLLYNAGNVALKLKQPGWAIVYYERALLAWPRDPDLRANLALAQAECRVSGSLQPPDWFQAAWQNVRGFFTLNELTALAAGLYYLFCAGLIWRLRQGHLRRRYRGLLGASVCLWLLFSALAGSKWRVDYSPRKAVVVSSAALHSGPADTFPILRSVYPGEKAQIIRTEGLWEEIVLDTGAQGWITQTALQRVVPANLFRQKIGRKETLGVAKTAFEL